MALKLTFFTFVILISIGNSLGQVSLNRQNTFPSGITFEYGFGNYSVKDEYISKEKYSGTLPYYSFSWVCKHN